VKFDLLAVKTQRSPYLTKNSSPLKAFEKDGALFSIQRAEKIRRKKAKINGSDVIRIINHLSRNKGLEPHYISKTN
jgi:hypothetical protein